MGAHDEFRAIHRRVRMLGARAFYAGQPSAGGRQIILAGSRRNVSYRSPSAAERVRVMVLLDLLAKSRRCSADFWCYLGRLRALRSGGAAAYERHLARERFPIQRAA